MYIEKVKMEKEKTLLETEYFWMTYQLVMILRKMKLVMESRFFLVNLQESKNILRSLNFNLRKNKNPIKEIQTS